MNYRKKSFPNKSGQFHRVLVSSDVTWPLDTWKRLVHCFVVLWLRSSISLGYLIRICILAYRDQSCNSLLLSHLVYEICHSSLSIFTRILGSLLSAHIIITDTKQPFGDMTIKDYDDELLHMARDLAVRLLPAFENTKTGIPYPRVGVISCILTSEHNLLSRIYKEIQLLLILWYLTSKVSGLCYLILCRFFWGLPVFVLSLR